MEMEIVDANTLFGFWPFRRLDMSLPTLFNNVRKHGIKGACTLSLRAFSTILFRVTRRPFRPPKPMIGLFPLGPLTSGSLWAMRRR